MKKSEVKEFIIEYLKNTSAKTIRNAICELNEIDDDDNRIYDYIHLLMNNINITF